MRMKLIVNTLVKFLVGLSFVGAVLFIPAGTLNYTNGWLFICLLFIPMLILGLVLFFVSPSLLEKRLNSKEKESTQKGVVALSALLFFIGFIIAGLDFRFGWSNVSAPVVTLASVILLISYVLYAEVMRENAYLSRTIEVQEGQKVISTGLYGIVRHPMYAVTIWLFLAIPLVLGSWISFLCFLPYLPIIIVRIINEEKVLVKGLEGYTDYKAKVKYRLIPFVW